MGLHTTSVECPHSVVMAPTLTDTTESPTFKLQRNSRIASPINSIIGQKCYITYKEKNDMSTCKLSDGNLSNGFKAPNALVLATELLQDNFFNKISAPDSVLNFNGSTMNNCSKLMNNCFKLTGDQDNKIGFQKAHLEFGKPCLSKEKDNIDRAFNDVSEPSKTDGNDIGQHVEEIMQVIKCIDGNNERLEWVSNDVDLCGNDMSGNFTLLEKELFNDVNVTNLNLEEPAENVDLLKETKIKELWDRVTSEEDKIEKSIDQALKRVRNVEAKVLGRHFSEEIAGVYEYAHQILRHCKEGSSTSSDEILDEVNKLSDEKMKPISITSAKKLIKKLEVTTILQSNMCRRKTYRYFGDEPLEVGPIRTMSGVVSLPPWTLKSKKSLKELSGSLRYQVHKMEQAADSEATASSSGGESADETDNFKEQNKEQHSM